MSGGNLKNIDKSSFQLFDMIGQRPPRPSSESNLRLRCKATPDLPFRKYELPIFQIG